jgi:hypothetical protein
MVRFVTGFQTHQLMDGDNAHVSDLIRKLMPPVESLLFQWNQ